MVLHAAWVNTPTRARPDRIATHNNATTNGVAQSGWDPHPKELVEKEARRQGLSQVKRRSFRT